jgi:UDP-glucose 4-epimerase
LDLASAHLAALESTGTMEPGQEVMNLGTGHGYSVREVLAAADAVVGSPIPHRIGPRRPGDPPALVASGTRAAERLGWRPAHGTLDAMIGSAWRWMRARAS